MNRDGYEVKSEVKRVWVRKPKATSGSGVGILLVRRLISLQDGGMLRELDLTLNKRWERTMKLSSS